MIELQGTFVCNSITGFHGKYCVTGEFMNSRQEKAEEPENLGNRTGKGRSGAVPVPLPAGCARSHHARTLIPQLHGCHRQTGFPAGYNDKATSYFHKSSPLQGYLPQISPWAPGTSLGQPGTPAARHGSGPVALEGTRVIFSTEP